MTISAGRRPNDRSRPKGLEPRGSSGRARWRPKCEERQGGPNIITLIGRAQLDRVYPLPEQLESTDTVYAAWLTGRGFLRSGSPISNHVTKFEKLILPDPTSESISALSKMSGLDISKEIGDSIKYATSLSIPVRQYPAFWGIAVTIGDPRDESGWVHCECCVPGLREDRRLCYRIEKGRSPSEFDALVEAFDAMWDQANPNLAISGIPPSLPADEREHIQDLRTLWNRFGEQSAEHLLDLFRRAVHELEDHPYFTDLLRERIDEFEAAIEGMTDAVAVDSTFRLEDVRNRFNEMYAAYLDAVKRVAHIDARDIPLNQELLRPMLLRWQQSHRRFREKLAELHQRPEYHETLKIFPDLPAHAGDPVFSAFLRVAEDLTAP